MHAKSAEICTLRVKLSRARGKPHRERWRGSLVVSSVRMVAIAALDDGLDFDGYVAVFPPARWRAEQDAVSEAYGELLSARSALPLDREVAASWAQECPRDLLAVLGPDRCVMVSTTRRPDAGWVGHIGRVGRRRLDFSPISTDGLSLAPMRIPLADVWQVRWDERYLVGMAELNALRRQDQGLVS